MNVLARVYEYPDPQHIAGAAPDAAASKRGKPPRRPGMSGLAFFSAAVVIGCVLFGWAWYRSSDPVRAGLAALIGLAAVAAVYLLIRAFRKEKPPEIGKLRTAPPDRRVELVLEQLDDRFAIFRGVRAGDTPVDHLIVGPTGLFAVVDSASIVGDHVDPRADAQAVAEAEAVRRLLREILPTAEPDIQPVVCVAPGEADRVARDDKGVWVVPADKLAVSLIKRSDQEGAITHNVNETGAFSSDALQSAAIERALANHWSIPTRKTIADYLAPPVPRKE